MRKHLTLLAAATLSAGSFAFLGSNTFAEDLRAAGSVTVGSDKASASASTNLPQGITRSDQSDNRGIQQTLAGATSAAIEGSGLSRLQMYLTQSDWSRLNQAIGQNKNQQLTQALDQFKQAWKAKYNKDFDVQGNAEVVFGNQFSNFQIVQGEISNPALLSNWPVGATNKSSTEFKSSTDTQNRSGIDTQDRSSTDTQYRSSTTTDRNVSGSTSTDRNTSDRSGSGVDENRIRATVGGASSPPAEVTPEGQGRGTQTDRNTSASGSVSTDRSSTSGSASTSVQPGSSSSTYQRSTSTYDRSSTSGSTGTGASASGSASVGSSGSTSGSYTGSSSTTGKNLERGMNVAIVTFPASHGAPELTVSLVREGAAGASGSSSFDRSSTPGSTSGSSSLDRSGTSGSSSTPNASGSANIGGSTASGSANLGDTSTSGTASGSASGSTASGSIDTGTTGTSGTASSNLGGTSGMSNWKIDLPDTVTADRIQSNLAEHLNHIVQMKDQLPADQNDAYRMVAHHVMMALYDVPASGQSNLNQSSPNQSGTTR